MCKHSLTVQLYRLMTGVALGVAVASAYAQEAAKIPLTVQVSNNHLPGAMFYLAVFKAGHEQANWQQNYHQALKWELPADDPAGFTLELAPGDYAMRAFVDVNANEALDTARFNRPTEPFAVSVGTGRGQPSMRFRNAVFTVDEATEVVHLRLIYPEDQPDSDNLE